MKYRILHITPFLLILFCTACKKEAKTVYDNPWQLPNATITGSNTFACRLNEENWIAQFSIYNTKTSFLTNNSRDSFSFTTGASNPKMSLITFTVFDRIAAGKVYDLSDTTKIRVYALRTNAPCGPVSGYGGSQWNRATTGKLTITRFSGTYQVPAGYTYGSYEPQSIVSGTFEFVAPVAGCDTIRMTNGRFDVNYSAW